MSQVVEAVLDASELKLTFEKSGRCQVDEFAYAIEAEREHE